MFFPFVYFDFLFIWLSLPFWLLSFETALILMDVVFLVILHLESCTTSSAEMGDGIERGGISPSPLFQTVSKLHPVETGNFLKDIKRVWKTFFSHLNSHASI